MKKFLLLLAAAGMMIACGGGNEPTVKSATAKVTSEGGEYTLSNGVTLIVPSGAVSGTTEVKVDYLEYPDESTGTLPNDIQGMVRFEPEGLVFDRPIQVKMPLNQPAQGKTDIIYWSAGDERWYITDRGETAGGEVTFYVDHFSSYASIGGGWSDIFSTMDTYVGGSDNEEAISNAVKRFLEQELWEEMGMKDLHFAAHTSAGNSCAKACGLYGFWSSEQGGKTRQGGGVVKEKSKHNLVSTIAMSSSQMTSHLQSETQIAADRIIEIYGEPCATELTGSASPATVEKGKKTTVTIKAHCDGSPLADQLIQISCSPELSCGTVNKKTDSNGEIEISVKGEEEGTGIVYAKAVSTIDPEIETEIQIPVKVGDGDNWRITLDMHIKCTSSFIESNTEGIYTEDYKVEGSDQSIEYGFTEVIDITIGAPQKFDQYIYSQISGKASVTNHRDEYKCDLPTFRQSGKVTIMDIVSTASMSQTLSASPEFQDFKDIPIVGTYSSGEGKTMFAFFVGYSDLDAVYSSSAEDDYNMLMKYTFFNPNITGSWSASDSDDRNEDGTILYGKIGMMDGGNGHSLAICSAVSSFSNSVNLQEETIPIQYSTDDYSLMAINVGNYGISGEWAARVGIYPTLNWVGLADWTGKRHWTVTGTLKVEQLDKK